MIVDYIPKKLDLEYDLYIDGEKQSNTVYFAYVGTDSDGNRLYNIVNNNSQQ